MGGTSFSWDQRQNRKGIFQILIKHQGRIFIAKWMQMQHSPRLNQSQLSSPTQASTTWCFFKTFGWDPIMKQFEQHCQRWFTTRWVHSSSGKIVFCIILQNRVMTRVGDLAPALCDGRVLPTSCSGLALVSRCLKGLHHFRGIHFADMLRPWLRFWEKKLVTEWFTGSLSLRLSSRFSPCTVWF